MVHTDLQITSGTYGDEGYSSTRVIASNFVTSSYGENPALFRITPCNWGHEVFYHGTALSGCKSNPTMYSNLGENERIWAWPVVKLKKGVKIENEEIVWK